MKTVDGIMNTDEHNSSYRRKVDRLLHLFMIAETLTESPTELANRVRIEFVNRGFYHKVLDMTKRLNPKSTTRIVRGEGHMQYLSGLFKHNATSQSSSLLTAQMKSIILDLKSKAKQKKVLAKPKLQGMS